MYAWFHFFIFYFFSSRIFVGVFSTSQFSGNAPDTTLIRHIKSCSIQIIDFRFEIYYPEICVPFWGRAEFKCNNLWYHWHNYIRYGFEVCFWSLCVISTFYLYIGKFFFYFQTKYSISFEYNLCYELIERIVL